MSFSRVLPYCLGSLAVLSGLAGAIPPPVSPADNVHETTVDIDRRDKATLYTVTFAHLPSYVTGDDFDAHIIGNSVLKVIVGGTNFDWFFKLADPIPNELTLKPPVEAERLAGDFTGAVWKVSVLIPKHFYSAPAAAPGAMPG
ncbi:hypothetical protein CSUI_000081, partial [Cystoisospora suis]